MKQNIPFSDSMFETEICYLMKILQTTVYGYFMM